MRRGEKVTNYQGCCHAGGVLKIPCLAMRNTAPASLRCGREHDGRVEVDDTSKPQSMFIAGSALVYLKVIRDKPLGPDKGECS